MWKNFSWDSGIKVCYICSLYYYKNVVFMKKEKLSLDNQATIAKNLLYLRKKKGFTQEVMAEVFELSTAQYQHYELGIRLAPLQTLIKVSEYFHISIDALVKVDLSEVKQDGIMEIHNGRMLLPVFISKEEERETIQVVTEKASAGYLIGYGDPTYLRKLPQVNLPFLRNGTFRGFPIKGDSMLPIKSGTIIIGQFVERIGRIRNGNTYIVVTKEGIVYKRVEYKNNTLILSSDNPLYPSYSVALEDVLEVWAFACAIAIEEMDKIEYPLENIYPLISNTFNKVSDISKELFEIKSKLSSGT